MQRLTRNKLAISGVLVSLILVLLGWYAYSSQLFSLPGWLDSQTPTPDATYSTQTPENTAYSLGFKSDISGVELLQPINSELLEQLFTSAGFAPGEFQTDILSNTPVNPTSVVVVFKDIYTHPDPTTLTLFYPDPNNEPLSGFASQYYPDSQELVYEIYIHPRISRGDYNLAYMWTQEFARLLFFTTNKGSTGEQVNAFRQSLETFMPFESGQPLFELRDTRPDTSLLPHPLRFVWQLLAPQPAYAQSCTGLYECGQWLPAQPCAANTGPCNSQGKCQLSGASCNLTVTCNCTGGSCGARMCSGNAACTNNCDDVGGCTQGMINNCKLNSCPAGSIFCGGCINACRGNSKTCTQWITEECGAPPPPGGGGGGDPCADVGNCGQFCDNGSGGLNNSVCTGSTSCQNLPGNGLRCWSSCCPTGGSSPFQCSHININSPTNPSCIATGSVSTTVVQASNANKVRVQYQKNGGTWINGGDDNAVQSGNNWNSTIPGVLSGAGLYTFRADIFDGSNWHNNRCQGFLNVPACSKSCEVSMTGGKISFQTGEAVSIGLVGESYFYPNSEQTLLYIAKTDFSRISNFPAGLSEVYSTAANGYIYQVTNPECWTNPDACNRTFQINGLPTGNYHAYCQMNTNPDRCTGNPVCAGGTCNGFADCGTNSRKTFSVSCTPNCSAPFCGGSDGCGGTCSNADSGAPSVVTGFLPASGNYNMNGATNVVASWQAPATNGAKVDAYQKMVFTTGSVTTTNAAAMQAYWDAAAPTGRQIKQSNLTPSLTFAPSPTYGRNLTIAVRAVNNTCSLQPSDWLVRNITLVENAYGNIYETSGACSGGSLVSPQAGSTVRETAVSMDGTITGSSYVIPNLPYRPSTAWSAPNLTGRLTLNNTADPSNTLLCASCHGGSGTEQCTRGDLLTGTDQHFYTVGYNLASDPWWQARGGLVYGGTSINSQIPVTSCTTDPNCREYLSLKDDGNRDRSAGPLFTSAATITAGDSGFWAVDESDQPNSRLVNFSAVQNQPENYAYFTSKVALEGAQLSSNIDTFTQLTGGSNPETNTYVYHRNDDLTVSPGNGQTWSIPANRRVIIFVDGNLTFRDDGIANRQLFSVPQTSYLAFIVSGEIIIDSTVGHTITDSTYATLIPNISAVLVANEIRVASDGNPATQDRKFVGEGTFVGWNNITLERNFDDGALGGRFNAISPVNTFMYRPAFLENTPDLLKSPGITWQEVN